MSTFRTIVLSDGTKTKVYMPPVIKITMIVDRKYPIPPAPVIKQKTAMGDEIDIEIVDDPDYLKQKQRVLEKRATERDEWVYLYALRDVSVPEWFDVNEYADLAREGDPDWKPRDGARGRKLDYLEWCILADPVNWTRVNQALNDLLNIDSEVIDEIEASFRN